MESSSKPPDVLVARIWEASPGMAGSRVTMMLNCHVELVSPQELSLSSIANLIRDRTRGSVNDGTVASVLFQAYKTCPRAQ